MTNQFSQSFADKFKEMGMRIRKERDDYRANSKLWQLRERARTLKTRKAQDKAWHKFYDAFKAKFPEGSTIWIDEGIHFNTWQAGGFVAYNPRQVIVRWNNGRDIHFESLPCDTVEIYYDPCGHDNLMALEKAQLNGKVD